MTQRGRPSRTALTWSRCASAGSEAFHPRTSRITVGTHVIAVDDYGTTAPPVLLLHGIPGWRGLWRNVAAHLETNCRVIAPDLLGFGESSAPAGEVHASGQAGIVVQMIRQLACGPVHLVGFDFGGPIAVLVYRQAPELVSSLTLAGTNVFTDTPIPVALRCIRWRVVGDLAGRLLFGRLGLTMVWFAAVRRKNMFPLAHYREMLRFSQGLTSTRRVFQASLRHLSKLYGPVQATLGTISVPCTVIWGDGDPFFPLTIGKRTSAAIPGATLVEIPDCGHFSPAEDSAGFAHAVMSLVRSTTSRGRTAVSHGLQEHGDVG